MNRLCIFLILGFLLMSCSERAEILEFEYKNTDVMFEVMNEIGQYHIRKGYFKQKVERLERLSNNSPSYSRFYKEGVFYDKQVSSVFHLSSKPKVTIYYYRSAFENDKDMSQFVIDIESIANNYKENIVIH